MHAKLIIFALPALGASLPFSWHSSSTPSLNPDPCVAPQGTSDASLGIFDSRAWPSSVHSLRHPLEGWRLYWTKNNENHATATDASDDFSSTETLPDADGDGDGAPTDNNRDDGEHLQEEEADEHDGDYSDYGHEEEDYLKPIGRGKCVVAAGKIVDCPPQTPLYVAWPERDWARQQAVLATGYENVCITRREELVPCNQHL